MKKHVQNYIVTVMWTSVPNLNFVSYNIKISMGKEDENYNNIDEVNRMSILIYQIIM